MRRFQICLFFPRMKRQEPWQSCTPTAGIRLVRTAVTVRIEHYFTHELEKIKIMKKQSTVWIDWSSTSKGVSVVLMKTAYAATERMSRESFASFFVQQKRFDGLAKIE